jgi:cytolysin-activating lysine-acyltransferase
MASFGRPRAVALADELVARRIDAGDKRLAAVEWKSGTNMRIIDIVAPFGGEAEMRGQAGAIVRMDGK